MPHTMTTIHLFIVGQAEIPLNWRDLWAQIFRDHNFQASLLPRDSKAKLPVSKDMLGSGFVQIHIKSSDQCSNNKVQLRQSQTEVM